VYPVADSSWVEGSGNGIDSSSKGGQGLTWIEVDKNGDGVLDELDGSPYVPDFTEPVVSLGGVSKGQTLQLDVTTAFEEGPGMYTLAISGGSGDGATYSSRERMIAERRPTLHLELESDRSCTPDGARCTDGDLCTWPDTCQAGDCEAGNRLICAALDQCHDAGTCDPATGRCSNPPSEDGTPCDDVSLCTQGDVCVAGVCAGENRVICAALDQCHGAGVCDPATGACSRPVKPDRTPCDDGNGCTQRDMCVAGVCVGADPMICVAPDQCNEAGACDPATGACSRPVKVDGIPCDDGNACTLTDTCTGGLCVGADPVICEALDECHDARVCDPTTGLCSISAKSDEIRLSFEAEADTHTSSDQPVTSFGTLTSLRLDGLPERRVYLRFNVSGIRDLPINSAFVRLQTTDEPIAGTDQGGGIRTVTDNTWGELTLTHANRPPMAGPVLASVGAIEPVQMVDFDVTGAIAGDGIYSFGIEAGSSNLAIFRSREAAVGQPELVVFTRRSCDDGDACTRTDSCVGGRCVGRNPVVCTALDRCHDAGVCDPATGVCTNPAKANGTPCEDGVLCNGPEACVTGRCEPGTPVDCDDAVGCTEDVCEEATGTCVHNPQNTACDSGIHCDGVERCDVGLGCVAEPADCDDQIPCTVDVCDEEAGGCVHLPDDESCDDGSVCTTDACSPVLGCEYMESGVCQPIALDLEPRADTYIEKGAEGGWDHGAAGHLDADTRPRGIIYLKFDLGGLAAPVKSATLRLYCMNASDDGGTVYPVADSSWLEGSGNGIDSSSAGGPGLTWIEVDTNGDGVVDKRDGSPYVPDFAQPVVSLGGAVKGQTLRVDVTTAVQGGAGMYTLAITNNSSDGVTYWSREHSNPDRRPALHLELGPPGPY